ncbi:type II toxin-antitoxin system VapC family toxin [candidate division KSB1 bacterium]|nr:type II toxin-antitoxin system VapC family toxin [candidate division KSB1 bacterium]
MTEQAIEASAFQATTTVEHFVFDACAFITVFNNEIGADKAEQLIERAESGEVALYVASINIYEVYYDALRSGSLDDAEELLNDLYALPITIVETIDQNIMRQAAHFKITHKMSLADSIALGLAKHLNARVVSTDHHEFDAVEKSGEVKVFWLR